VDLLNEARRASSLTPIPVAACDPKERRRLIALSTAARSSRAFVTVGVWRLAV
jgi:hypothetical protein